MASQYNLPPIWRSFHELWQWMGLGPYQGKLNVTGEVTLAANEATTVYQDPRIGAESYIALMPLTANAAADYAAGIYFSSQDEGTVTINHTNDADTDKDFRVLIMS